MNKFSRRDFLQWGSALAASFGLGADLGQLLASGLEKAFKERKRVLWLQAQSCSGCSVSLLNSDRPGIREVLTDLISLVFHSNVSAAQGQTAIEAIRKAVDEGGYYLVVEGSIPVGMPDACMLGDRPMASQLEEALKNAAVIISAGSCSAHGGIPAADGNETGAVSVQAFMESKGIATANRLVNCPGCPVHPETLVGTIAYAAAQGYPKVNERLLTPELFYKHSVHDDCPRFHYWQKEEFAKEFGEDGCLFKLGCLGPLSHTNCSRRQWNGGVNWCIRAGAPCIGCTSENFALRRDFSFYRKGEAAHAVQYTEQERKGAGR